MKRINILFLSILIFGLLSCKKKTQDEYAYYFSLASIVGYDTDFKSPVLLTSVGSFLAPQLQNDFVYYLGNGAAILADLEFVKDQPVSGEYTILTDIFYTIVNKELPQETEGGDFADPDFIAMIDSIAPYDMVSNVAFFLFFHTAPVMQQYYYEMTYDPVQAVADAIPAVYLRAKENGRDEINKTGAFYRYFAFNLNSFIETYHVPGKKFEINIKFFAGRDDNGVDIYKDWKHNPLELMIKN